MPSRRTVLAGVGSAGALGLAGVLATGRSSIEARPGGETRLVVTPGPVGALRLEPSPEGVTFGFGDERLVPPPTGGADSRPPIWFWDYPAPAVRLSIPVTVGTGVSPGEYELAFEVWAEPDRASEPRVETVTLTVSRG